MAVLKVICKKCKRPVDTGFDVDYDTFQGLTYTERTLECQVCGSLQVWELDDVDKSVFKKS